MYKAVVLVTANYTIVNATFFVSVRVCSVCGEKETNVLEKLTPKPEDPKKPVIPNTAENAAVYAAISVFGVTALFAVVAVSVYKLRKKQLFDN